MWVVMSVTGIVRLWEFFVGLMTGLIGLLIDGLFIHLPGIPIVGLVIGLMGLMVV